jgi:uncharacterized protein (TIGR03083 family)
MVESHPLAVPDTVPLFPPLRAGLLTLLRSLEPADWDQPTLAGAWKVRDVVAHLLNGELRKLSVQRDAHVVAADGAIRSYDDVVNLVNRLNDEGVRAGRHLSASILTDLLAVSGEWMQSLVVELDPDARAPFAVAWAGEAESSNLFDTAREYTERWHHEMQIRLAVGARGQPEKLLEGRFAVPLIETSLRVLPHAYRDVSFADGATLVLGVKAQEWERTYTLRREAGTWQVHAGAADQPAGRIDGDVDAWWRLLYNALPAGDATTAFTTSGAPALLAPLLRARSVMV